MVIRTKKGRPVGRDHIDGIKGFRGDAKTRLAGFRDIHRTTFLFHLKECEFAYNHPATKSNAFPDWLDKADIWPSWPYRLPLRPIRPAFASTNPS